MIPDIKDKKCVVCGLQGGGKTFYAKEVIRRNNYKVLVYSPHYYEFESENDNFVYFQGFPANFQNFFYYAKELARKGYIDGVFIDEFDVVFRNNFDINQQIQDIFANHRHYGMFLLGITRRPQDIPSVFMESSAYIISFALQGENVRRKFNGIFKGFGDMVIDNLSYDNYEYAIKQIAMPPKKYPAITPSGYNYQPKQEIPEQPQPQANSEEEHYNNAE